MYRLLGQTELLHVSKCLHMQFENRGVLFSENTVTIVS